MQIVLLGAGGYHPNSRRHTACVMLPELGVVFDAGTASFRIPQHLATDQLDIFLSHTHLDHVFGLTTLIGLFKGDDPAKIRVHGEAEKLATLQEHLFSPLLFPVKANFTPHPIEPGGQAIEVAGGTQLASGAQVTSFPLVGHPGGSIGFRLEVPASSDQPARSMAYVTDTIADITAPYVNHLQGVDVLIHEAYFDDDRREFANLTGHSCLGDVVAIAEKVQAKQLVLVHMNPREETDEPLDLTEAKQRVPKVSLGADGDAIRF
ncbi:MAG: MBL fold metallo-hydrolase [Planctomycetota bacterium]